MVNKCIEGLFVLIPLSVKFPYEDNGIGGLQLVSTLSLPLTIIELTSTTEPGVCKPTPVGTPTSPILYDTWFCTGSAIQK